MKKLTKESFIEKVNIIWNNKFDYSEVEYINGLTDIKVICPEHGLFITKPQWHLQKSQCPECSKLVRKIAMTKFNQENKRLSNEDWILKARKIHNNKFDYSKTNYINATTKIIIICSEHGEHLMFPHSHIEGHGCPVCAKIATSNSNTLTQQQFLDRVKDIPNLSFEKTLYVSKREKVIVTCKIHGDYETTAEVLLKGGGCKKCASDKLSGDRIWSTDGFIQKATLIHGDKYDYSNVNYTGTFNKVDILCKKHNLIFSQTPASHIQNSGCPLCKSSQAENTINLYLSNKNIKFETQKTFSDLKFIRLLKFDFYLIDHNILIEYDGEQHFRPVDYFGGEEAFNNLQLKDKIKNEYCKVNNIPLLRIKYSDVNITDLIDNFIEENSCN